jgi:2'-5' RNA ligase
MQKDDGSEVLDASDEGDGDASNAPVDATAATPFPLSAAVYDDGGRPFVPNSAYLGLDVNFPPVDAARQLLQADLPYTLKTRGEAHITVVTPVEYQKTLKAKLPMATINQLAKTAGLQGMAFQVDCVGHASAVLDGHEEHAYFLVVESYDLKGLRQKIQDAFVAAGGAEDAFKPDDFQPHITLGFTKRDLHEEDGVVKDQSSCIRTVTITQ